MRIKPGFEIVNIAGDYMLIPVSDQIDKFNGTVILNEVSAFLITKLSTDIEKDELVSLLVKEYGIDSKTAQEDIDEALEKMKMIGIIYE